MISPCWRVNLHSECKPRLETALRCHIYTNAQPGVWPLFRTSDIHSCAHHIPLALDCINFQALWGTEPDGILITWLYKVVPSAVGKHGVSLAAFGANNLHHSSLDLAHTITIMSASIALGSRRFDASKSITMQRCRPSLLAAMSCLLKIATIAAISNSSRLSWLK